MTGKRTLYVGNLPYDITENELFDLFTPAGVVEHVRIVRDRETNRSKGFGFVEMIDERDAEGAIAKLNETDCKGRLLRVSYAVRDSAREPRSEEDRRQRREPRRDYDGGRRFRDQDSTT